MTLLEQIKTTNKLIQDINKILSEFSISEQISISDITVTEKTVSDLVKPDAKLSEAITNYLWSSIPSATVYHYTSLANAEDILNTQIFRLTNISKRYGEGEIETFCKTHELNGYLAKDENGVPVYKNLIMPNTFYASFTDTNLTKDREDYLWSNFATCDGVRLKLEITASNPNFRKLVYEQKKGRPIPILFRLINQIKEQYQREFILKGISRLCAFYLSGEDYGIENEIRALYRIWDGFGPQPKNDGSYSYIELPLGSMSECGYRIDIIEVQAINKPKMPDSIKFTKRVV